MAVLSFGVIQEGSLIIWLGIKRCINSIISKVNLFVISSAVKFTNIDVQSVFLRERRISSTPASEEFRTCLLYGSGKGTDS